MPLAVGTRAPAFTLPASDGVPRSLSDLLATGPVLLIFFKTTCPTCGLAFPVYGELVRRYGEDLAVVAVSQDPLIPTVGWLRDLGFEGLVLDDASDRYAVSRSFGVEVVPTLVLVGADGAVDQVVPAWDRDAINALAARLGGLYGRLTAPVSTPEDGRPAFKPG